MNKLNVKIYVEENGRNVLDTEDTVSNYADAQITLIRALLQAV